MTLFLYDGTYDGFLSAVFCAFPKKESSILRADGLEGPTLFDTVEVLTDPEKARRVTSGMKRLSGELPGGLYRAWLSELSPVDDHILAALRLGFQANRDPLLLRYHPSVKFVCGCIQKVDWEVERMLQFVRFVDTGGVFVADVEPQFDILPLIANHFHMRFGAQRILIRDLHRRRAVVSGEDGWFIAELTEPELQPVQGTGEFEELWQRYFKAIANQARLNPKLQQKFVPLRYRPHLTEFQR